MDLVGLVCHWYNQEKNKQLSETGAVKNEKDNYLLTEKEHIARPVSS